MMKDKKLKEFNLSDNIFIEDGFISVHAVKEFIRRLKEDLNTAKTTTKSKNSLLYLKILEERIDKLAGEDLK